MQRSALCVSRRELSNAYFLAKFGLDTAENEPCKVCNVADSRVYSSLDWLNTASTSENRYKPETARPRGGWANQTMSVERVDHRLGACPPQSECKREMRASLWVMTFSVRIIWEWSSDEQQFSFRKLGVKVKVEYTISEPELRALSRLKRTMVLSFHSLRLVWCSCSVVHYFLAWRRVHSKICERSCAVECYILLHVRLWSNGTPYKIVECSYLSGGVVHVSCSW